MRNRLIFPLRYLCDIDAREVTRFRRPYIRMHTLHNIIRHIIYIYIHVKFILISGSEGCRSAIGEEPIPEARARKIQKSDRSVRA